MSMIRKLRVALSDHLNATGRNPARINAGRTLLGELGALCTHPVTTDANLPAGAWGTFLDVPVYRALVDDFELVADDPVEALKERVLESLSRRPGGSN